MIKTKACLELEIAGKTYTFLCEADAQLNDVLQAVSQMRTLVLGRIADAQEAQENAKPKDAA